MMPLQQNMSDVIVIGAGLAGIVFASRYLSAHPKANVVILDKQRHVGGIWSREHMHPYFYAQWTHGLSEFSDLEMERPPEEDCIGDTYRAKYTMEYLEKYVEKSEYGGIKLHDRIKFGVDVEKVWKEGEVWKVRCRDVKLSGSEKMILEARKVVVASGPFTTPKIPSLLGQELFSAPIIHSSQFAQSSILSMPQLSHIAVVGAGKSAADMLYALLKSSSNLTASWIIREDGRGPGFFAPVDLPSPYKNAQESAQTRLMTALQPCILHEDGWWVWLLHRTWLGIALVGWIFRLLDDEVKKVAKYQGRPHAKGFEKLEYAPGIFWQNNTGGALHHSDFWDLVAERVTVHRAHISALGPKRIQLSEGTHVSCDALLLGTGWGPGLGFFSNEVLRDLGLPHDPNIDVPDDTARWEKLELDGDAEVLKRFPILANPPAHVRVKPKSTPYRLYNGIMPLRDQSIALVGHVQVGNMLMGAEVEAMWTVALFDGNLSLPTLDRMEREVALWIAYCKRRYLSSGEMGLFAAFDSVKYADKLISEMGSKTYWKGWGKDAWEVNRPSDFGRVWKEYLSKQEMTK